MAAPAALAGGGAQERYEQETRRFIEDYKNRGQAAVRLEKSDNALAADAHVAISALIAKYVSANERFIPAPLLTFYHREMFGRCSQALVLRSMQLSGFADLAFSMSAARKLRRDIALAQRRLNEAREEENDDADNDVDDARDDPRANTNGLYEFVPWEDLDKTIDDLPGYESQHRDILNAYYIINNNERDELRRDDAAERKPRTRAGANLILYGPPGTGKTAAARAVARSLGLNLAFVNAENLLSAYRSETEKNLRALYEKKRAIVRVSGRNVVLLLDEVNGLVKNHSGGAAVTSGEYSLLTRFLTILEPNDGKDNYGVFSVFTTNKRQNLDAAFLRRCSSVFMGYVEPSEARVRLFNSFFGSSLSDANRQSAATLERIASVCRHWVPGDYVQFKRSVLDGHRFQAYLDSQNLTYDRFISTFRQRKTTGGNSDERNRDIFVNLPLVETESLLNLAETERFEPVTPLAKYGEYKDV